MRAGDESFERLRAALEDVAAGEVDELLAEARAEARARVRSMLTEAMAQAMLERAREQLEISERPAPPPRGRAVPPPSRAPVPPPSRAPAPPPAAGGPAGFGWYVYCVTHADGTEVPADLPGIDPAHEVRALKDGRLVAVVSRVPLEDFDEERLRERLADMNWLERTARRHEQVLDTIRAQRTVIPMRLCSIYRDESGVRAMLEREADALTDALARLDGKAEWGVKVFQVGDVAPPPPSENGATDDDDTGAAYMARRGLEHQRRRQGNQRMQEACNVIHERLSATAVEGLVAAPQRSEVSDHDGEMILNGVYLVPDSDQDSFHSELAALQAEFEPLGLELELTGPWPAYNFIPGTIGAAW
jgi:hypothetical protein